MVASVPARAEGPDCRHIDQLSEMDGETCAQQDAKKAENGLQAAYDALRAAAPAKDGVRLRDAERAWVSFREAECSYRVGDREGTLWPRLLLQCMSAMATERTRYLGNEMKCASWDLSCPAQ
jgi:uncharacterized protein YecT (DUF1311 family)